MLLLCDMPSYMRYETNYVLILVIENFFPCLYWSF